MVGNRETRETLPIHCLVVRTGRSTELSDLQFNGLEEVVVGGAEEQEDCEVCGRPGWTSRIEVSCPRPPPPPVYY